MSDKNSDRRDRAEKSAKVEPQSPASVDESGKDAFADWRSHAVGRVRSLIRQAVPDVVEEVKWRKPSNSMVGVPVWSSDGIICTGETYKDKVKLTFAKGAFLEDPTGLFNSSLEGNTRRAIDIHEGGELDEVGFKALIRAAATLNEVTANTGAKKGKRPALDQGL